MSNQDYTSLESYIEDSIDFLGMLESIKLFFNHILLLVFFSICLWLTYITTSTRIYESSSLIQIINSGPIGSTSYESSLMGGSQINADEQIELYLSRSNLLRVVEELRLDLFINGNPYNFYEENQLIINKFKYKSDGESKEFYQNYVEIVNSIADLEKDV